LSLADQKTMQLINLNIKTAERNLSCLII